MTKNIVIYYVPHRRFNSIEISIERSVILPEALTYYRYISNDESGNKDVDLIFGLTSLSLYSSIYLEEAVTNEIQKIIRESSNILFCYSESNYITALSKKISYLAFAISAIYGIRVAIYVSEDNNISMFLLKV